MGVVGGDGIFMSALAISAIVIDLQCGGLYSAIWTDFFQEYLALIGLLRRCGW
jgi:hypothetical protein